jgi:hypothetical protein
MQIWTPSGLWNLECRRGVVWVDNNPQRQLDGQPWEMAMRKKKELWDQAKAKTEVYSKAWHSGTVSANELASVKEDHDQTLKRCLRFDTLQQQLRSQSIRPFVLHSAFLRFVAILTCALPAARLLAYLHRRWRPRLPNGLCPTCGYDLRATPDRCPECGTVPGKVKA